MRYRKQFGTIKLFVINAKSSIEQAIEILDKPQRPRAAKKPRPPKPKYEAGVSEWEANQNLMNPSHLKRGNKRHRRNKRQHGRY